MRKNTQQHISSKESDESFAKCILLGVLDGEFTEIQIQDRPDLLAQPGDIGIEVTRAMYPNEGISRDFLRKNSHRTHSEIGEKPLAILEQNGFKPFFVSGTLHGIMPKCARAINETILVYVFKGKLNKLQKFSATDFTDLFIYAPVVNWFSPYHIEDFIDRACLVQESFTRKFRRVYIYQHSCIFLCDLNNHSLSTKQLSDELIQQYCQNIFSSTIQE